MFLTFVMLVVRAIGGLPFFPVASIAALNGGLHGVCSWVSNGMTKVFHVCLFVNVGEFFLPQVILRYREIHCNTGINKGNVNTGAYLKTKL